MKNSMRSVAAFSLALCLCSTLLSGCNVAGRNVPAPNQPGGNTQLQQITPRTNVVPNAGMTNTSPGGINATPNANYPGVTRVQQQINNPVGFDTQRAENITKKRNSKREFQKVHTVVYGNTAIVGYKMADGMKDVNAAKNLAISSVKAADKSITNVVASDSGDIMTQLIQMTNDIKGGKPLNELTTRFTKLTQTITPAAK